MIEFKILDENKPYIIEVDGHSIDVRQIISIGKCQLSWSGYVAVYGFGINLSNQDFIISEGIERNDWDLCGDGGKIKIHNKQNLDNVRGELVSIWIKYIN